MGYIYIESDFLISDVWRHGMLNTKSVWTIYQTGGSEGGRGEERGGRDIIIKESTLFVYLFVLINEHNS